MARLTAAARKRLPAKDFGEPSKRKFPMEDKAHARDAKARASEEERKGKISKGTERAIDRKADKKLGNAKKGAGANAKKRPEPAAKPERPGRSMSPAEIVNRDHQTRENAERSYHAAERAKPRMRRTGAA